MKKITKKILILSIAALFILLFAIGIPFIINEAYKHQGGYITLWGASDVLGYYGTLLGTTATIIALVITVRITNRISISEYKKQKLVENNEALINNINTIKSILLLEDMRNQMFIQKLNNEQILEIMQNNFFEITSIIEKVINTFSKPPKSKELEFSLFTNKIMTQSINTMKAYVDEITETKKLNNFFKVSLLNCCDPKTKAKILKNPPPLVDSIYDKLNKDLIKQKKEYEKEYISLYNELIEFENNQLEQNIKELYSYRIFK